jgi:hypothetical protein
VDDLSPTPPPRPEPIWAADRPQSHRRPSQRQSRGGCRGSWPSTTRHRCSKTLYAREASTRRASRWQSITQRFPAGAGGVGLWPAPAGSPLCPSSSAAFPKPCQVGASGNTQGRLDCLAWPPAVALVLVAEAENHASPFGEQVPATVRDLPQLCHRGVDVERFPARVAGCSAGELGDGDPVRVWSAAATAMPGRYR